MHHIFRQDWDVVTYGEESPLSAADGREGLRWVSLPEVQDRVARDRAPLVVCKPLVESQILGNLLGLWPDSKAIWMYRDYRDVAHSNLVYFGRENGFRDLAPIIAGDQTNWRAENLAPAVRETICNLHTPEISPHDAAALYWYARNSLYFTRHYDENPNVRTCAYDDLITQPVAVMRAAYAFIGRPYPGDAIVKDVVGGSLGKGQDIVLHPGVEDICAEMLSRLHKQRQLITHGVQ